MSMMDGKLDASDEDYHDRTGQRNQIGSSDSNFPLLMHNCLRYSRRTIIERYWCPLVIWLYHCTIPLSDG